MLAHQLCVFDDKADSKSKWVKKLIVWLCCLNYLLVYLWRYQSEMITQGIRTIKTFIKYKSATAGKFITKKTQVSSVECWDHGIS